MPRKMPLPLLTFLLAVLTGTLALLLPDTSPEAAASPAHAINVGVGAGAGAGAGAAIDSGASTARRPSSASSSVHGPVAATVLDVVDGDTLRVRAHIWVGQNVETLVRLQGVDTPEMKGRCQKERTQAQATRAEVEKLLSGTDIVLYDVKEGKYAGRVLARVVTADGVDISRHLLDRSLARPYAGKKRQGWC